ncbi:hypothetical protein LWI29_000943 [Acer saccharum]|uniref:Uncharacterized protein n=1 Tax=Acer saccharum TaxID=4024 RepID=A0AA39TMV0_ACESA|nr:hypothetical protein LWI29_000943 [Acer saccharum]
MRRRRQLRDCEKCGDGERFGDGTRLLRFSDRERCYFGETCGGFGDSSNDDDSFSFCLSHFRFQNLKPKYSHSLSQPHLPSTDLNETTLLLPSFDDGHLSVSTTAPSPTRPAASPLLFDVDFSFSDETSRFSSAVRRRLLLLRRDQPLLLCCSTSTAPSSTRPTVSPLLLRSTSTASPLHRLLLLSTSCENSSQPEVNSNNVDNVVNVEESSSQIRSDDQVTDRKRKFRSHIWEHYDFSSVNGNAIDGVGDIDIDDDNDNEVNEAACSGAANA